MLQVHQKFGSGLKLATALSYYTVSLLPSERRMFGMFQVDQNCGNGLKLATVLCYTHTHSNLFTSKLPMRVLLHINQRCGSGLKLTTILHYTLLYYTEIYSFQNEAPNWMCGNGSKIISQSLTY